MSILQFSLISRFYSFCRPQGAQCPSKHYHCCLSFVVQSGLEVRVCLAFIHLFLVLIVVGFDRHCTGNASYATIRSGVDFKLRVDIPLYRNPASTASTSCKHRPACIRFPQTGVIQQRRGCRSDPDSYVDTHYIPFPSSTHEFHRYNAPTVHIPQQCMNE